MAEGRQPIVRQSGEGLISAWLDGSTVRHIVRGEDTDSAWALLEHTSPPAGREPPPKGLHVHRYTDQTFHVLTGTMLARLGSQTITASSGATIFIPRGTPHANWSIGDETTRILVHVSPAGLDRLFAEAGELIQSLGPDQAATAIKALTARYDSLAIF